jgi:hypothetical protein
VRLHERVDFKGLECDLTKESTVKAALEGAVRAFGGDTPVIQHQNLISLEHAADALRAVVFALDQGPRSPHRHVPKSTHSAQRSTRANLSQANLNRADLSGAYLGGANLTKTDLGKANLSRAYLDNANLREAIIGYTTFLNVDLSLVKGLDTVKHYGPSYIDVHTLYRSGGSIPEIFLRKAGIPNEFINYLERIKTPECLYTLEQLDEWIKNLQKRLTIVSRNLDDRKEVKALHGPLNIPLSLNNEIHALEQEQENIEVQIIEHKRLKTLYYS